MHILKLVLWMSSAITVTSLFTCPEMPNCACSEGIDLWLNAWTNVKVVNCSHRALKGIPDFSPLKDKTFHRLLLNNNNITAIRRHDFSNITVREIVLRKNPMRRIRHDAFREVRYDLEILDLDSDRITIDEGLRFLDGLYKLRVLDLGYNRLRDKYSEFPSEVFAGSNLSSLTTLTLQALQITQIDDGAFTGLENLEQLDLSYNFISDFPTELRRLKNLKGLKLYSNELTSIKNNTFTGLTQLKKLLIGVNEITADSIEPGAFNDLNNSIEEINFYQNPLYKVPSEVLYNLRNLKKLSFVKTNLENLENGSFVGEYNLEQLHLDDNPELTFSDEGMFNGVEDSLQVLYIRRLNLEKLPLQVLKRLGNLNEIDAADNAIKKIDKHFFNGLKLAKIKLMWNQIKHVDPRAFRKLDKGVELHLHSNAIRDISFILKVEECTFKEVYLTDNKIACSCDVEKVLNSGMVSEGIFGECYIERDGQRRWYSFNDKALMDYFERECNKTKPRVTCFGSTSGSSLPYLKSSIICYLVFLPGFILLRAFLL